MPVLLPVVPIKTVRRHVESLLRAESPQSFQIVPNGTNPNFIPQTLSVGTHCKEFTIKHNSASVSTAHKSFSGLIWFSSVLLLFKWTVSCPDRASLLSGQVPLMWQEARSYSLVLTWYDSPFSSPRKSQQLEPVSRSAQLSIPPDRCC